MQNEIIDPRLIEIIQKIGVLRTRANMSARELSLAIGKNPGYINRLETDKFTPTITVLLDIIEACNSTPEEFFYESISEYKTDKQVFDFFKSLSETQKKAIMNLYKS